MLSVSNKFEMLKLKKRLNDIDSAAMQRVIEYVDKLEGDLETERMRLAACGIAALSNTRESAALQRLADDSPYRSGSYDSVVDAVQREMTYRERMEMAIVRIKDMLMGDDGQARKEAQKFLDSLP